MKPKVTGSGSISTVFSCVVLLCVSSMIMIIITIEIKIKIRIRIIMIIITILNPKFS